MQPCLSCICHQTKLYVNLLIDLYFFFSNWRKQSSRCVCRHGSQSAYQELEPLLKALQVPCLSRAVQQSVVPVAGWSGSVELGPIIADCLLALQRYLVHHMPALYHTEQDTVAPLLLNLRYSHNCLP